MEGESSRLAVTTTLRTAIKMQGWVSIKVNNFNMVILVELVHYQVQNLRGGVPVSPFYRLT